jgi:hypothetical protein
VADERFIDHAWDEQAVRAGFCKYSGAIQCGADHGFVVGRCRFLEEDVSPCIDEQGNACITGGATGGGNPFRLFIDITQRSIPGETVLEVATDGAGLDCTCNTPRLTFEPFSVLSSIGELKKIGTCASLIAPHLSRVGIFRPRGTIIMQQAHTKAAEHHETAAKSHRAAAEQHGKNDHAKGQEYSSQAQQHSKTAREHSETAHNKSSQQPKK